MINVKIKFCPLASGSSGNSTYIGNDNTNILIDAGVSGIKIENALKSINVSPKNIDAIFITHEHSDHIIGVGVLSRRYDIPIYATENTWQRMNIGKIKYTNKNVIYIDENCIINDIVITPFAIPHDASLPVGYNIFYNNQKITLATDLGHINDNIISKLKDTNVLLLESNHDVELLKNGSYPYRLKQRILGDYGHLSNESCAKLLIKVLSDKLKHVYLGHLSKDNNTPSLAYETTKNYLMNEDIIIDKHFELIVAKRDEPSKLVVIN